jgi:hypothetical protein
MTEAKPAPVLEAEPATPQPPLKQATLPEKFPDPILLPDGKQLLMHYMPWYETPAVRGQWGSHWTGHQRQHSPDQLKENGLPDIWSHYHPLIGPYDSSDPDALECHLLQMKLAGVTGVIVDWYGISKAADYPPIHTATEALFAATEKWKLKFAVCFEDRTVKQQIDQGMLTEDQITSHLTETFQWMQENWFSQPQYVRMNGRPLLLDFGPIYIKDPKIWKNAFSSLPTPPAFFALHHLWRKAEADGGFSWVHQSAWEGNPEPSIVKQRLTDTFNRISENPEQVIVSATPGFKDVYANPHPTLDHRNGDTLRESLSAGMEGPWQIIQLVTWNDYGEGTIIEPTHEFGYTFLEIIQENRKKEMGDTFPFTSEDLRLPIRLYQLRKQGGVDPATLDGIAELLNRGAVQPARAALNELETQHQKPSS